MTTADHTRTAPTGRRTRRPWEHGPRRGDRPARIETRRPPAALAPAPTAPAAPPAAPAAAVAAPAAHRLEEVSGGRLLVSDLRVGFLLLNEARYRTLELIGVPREDANLVTLVGLGMLGQSVHAAARRIIRAPLAGTPEDAVLQLAFARELLYDAAGPAARQTPFFGALVTLAVAAKLSGPGVRATARSVRSASRSLTTSFHRRYGYLVDGHRRSHGSAMTATDSGPAAGPPVVAP